MSFPFSPRHAGPTGPIDPTGLPFFLSPPPTGWRSRHAWEVALLLHQVPQEVGERVRQALPTLLSQTPARRPARLEAGRWIPPEWMVIPGERFSRRELAVSPAELLGLWRRELRQALRTLATPERILGRGNRNRLLAGQSARLGQLFEALTAVIGFRPALQAVAQVLAERRL